MNLTKVHLTNPLRSRWAMFLLCAVSFSSAAVESPEVVLDAPLLLRQLSEITIDVLVDVTLVGFEGRETKDLLGVKSMKSYLQEYLEVLKPNRVVPHTVASHVSDAEEGKPLAARGMAFEQRILYRVQSSRGELSRTLRGALSEHRLHGPPNAKSAVPHELVDDVLANHVRSAGTASYTMYIIGPGGEKHFNTARQIPYWYIEPAEKDQQGKRQRHRCGRTGWVGDRERYLWLDLLAGPTLLGPSFHGNGAVTPASIPKIQDLINDQDKSVFLPAFAGLAAVIHRSVLHLALPPLHHEPARLQRLHRPEEPLRLFSEYGAEPGLIVRLIFLCDASACDDLSGIEYDDDAEDMYDATPEDEALTWVSQRPSWKRLSRLVEEVGEGAGRTVAIQTTTVSLTQDDDVTEGGGDDPMARILVGTLGSVRVKESSQKDSPSKRYLDSAYLTKHLAKVDTDQFIFYPPLEEMPSVDQSADVLPVFILRLDAMEPILFEQRRQSASSNGVVVSVETRGGGTVPSGLSCLRVQHPVRSMMWSDSGQPVPAMTHLDSTDAACGTLETILETAFGVRPAHVSWSPMTKKRHHDYLWASGECHLSLNFAQREAPFLGRIFRRLDGVVSTLISEATLFANAGVDLSAVASTHGMYEEMELHWLFIMQEIDRAGKYTALHDWTLASRHVDHAARGVQNLTSVFEQLWGYVTLNKLECGRNGPV